MKLLNLFITADDQIMVALSELIVFLDEGFGLLKNLHLNEIDPRIIYELTCFTKSLGTNKESGYLMACAFPISFTWDNYFQGSNFPDRSAWLVRCHLNTSAPQL